MKKFIIAAVVLVAMSAQAFAGPIVTVTVEFGHKPDCMDRGICRISVGVRGMAMQMNDKTGNLELTINRNESQQGVYEYQFANGVFEVPNDYALSSELCSKLGIGTFLIKAGKYKVIESTVLGSKNQYTIIFAGK